MSGTLAEKRPDRIVVDVQGVGYEVWIPFSTYYTLGEVGGAVSLHVYTHVKEDALSLYGFATLREKEFFTRLIQIPGIGPRLGVAVLSGLPTEDLIQAVLHGDVARLTTIPGIGRKTAERIVLELKEKVAPLAEEAGLPSEGIPAGSLQADVVSALVNLGYARNVAEKKVLQAVRENPDEDFQAILRKALRLISN